MVRKQLLLPRSATSSSTSASTQLTSAYFSKLTCCRRPWTTMTSYAGDRSDFAFCDKSLDKSGTDARRTAYFMLVSTLPVQFPPERASPWPAQSQLRVVRRAMAKNNINREQGGEMCPTGRVACVRSPIIRANNGRPRDVSLSLRSIAP